MGNVEILVYALLGGIIPALIWLEFWLREETHHEPRGLILGCFFAGMLSVIFAIPLEQAVLVYFPTHTFYSIFLWAAIEELLKFGAAYFVALKTRFIDEPIDATMYLITAALGFSAIENMLFLVQPLADGHIGEIIKTLNLRFVGASLLHVVSACVIGIFLGAAFYKNEKTKKIAGAFGIILAISLHTAFNSFIIENDNNLFKVFSVVWVGIIAIILILEKIKKIKGINSHI